MKKNHIILIFCWMVLLCGCQSQSEQNLKKENPEILTAIADPRSTEMAVICALKKLPEIKESPKFWSDIFNNSAYPLGTRQRAVLQLFARHFHSGMTLKEFALLLDHPAWIQEKDLFNCMIGSNPPFSKYEENDGIYAIKIFGDRNDEFATLNIRFAPEVSSRNKLFKCLQGDFSDSNISNIKVLQVGSTEQVSNYIFLFDKFGIFSDKDILIMREKGFSK